MNEGVNIGGVTNVFAALESDSTVVGHQRECKRVNEGHVNIRLPNLLSPTPAISYVLARSHGEVKSNWRNSCAISIGSDTTRFFVSS